MSPFDVVNSLVRNKESVYTTEQMFSKDYNPFMVNRILSNDQRTTLFADVINQYSSIDTKLQHDFYLYGIPKYSGRIGYAKKESQTGGMNSECIEYVCKKFSVSISRALEYISLIGESVILEEIESRGGRMMK